MPNLSFPTLSAVECIQTGYPRVVGVQMWWSRMLADTEYNVKGNEIVKEMQPRREKRGVKTLIITP